MALDETRTAGETGHLADHNSLHTYYNHMQPANAARVYNNAAIPTTTGVVATLTFNSERFDTNALHDTSTNTSRLTCKSAGIYLIVAQISFAANATGIRGVWLNVNGTGTRIAESVRNATTGGANTRMVISSIYQLAVNDYVEVQVYQDSTATVNIESAANVSPEFMMAKLSPIT